jgi:hypothetical protein
MKRSDSIAKIAPALIAAQSEMTAIERDSSNESEDGRQYKYTSLSALITCIRPILTKHGLCVIQGGDGEHVSGCIRMETTIIHESGEFISGEFIIPFTTDGKNPTQDAGAAITYCRRYMLSSMLALTSEEDTDASRRPVKKKQEPAPAEARKEAPPASPPPARKEPDPAMSPEEKSKSLLKRAMESVTGNIKKLQGSPADKIEAIAMIRKAVEYSRSLNAKGDMTDLHLQNLVDMTQEYLNEDGN